LRARRWRLHPRCRGRGARCGGLRARRGRGARRRRGAGRRSRGARARRSTLTPLRDQGSCQQEPQRGDGDQEADGVHWGLSAEGNARDSN
jgi:hypothetical protein